MRKIVFVLSFLVIGAGMLNAQEKSAKDFKIEGAAAYKQKDYKTALVAFEQAIKLYEADNNIDTTLYFNAGYCAYKTKDYDKAFDYLNTSLKMNYKPCTSKLLIATVLKKKNKAEEMLAMAEEGMNTCPKQKSKFKKLIAGHHKKVALKAYNKASQKLAEINSLATTNPAKYKTEMKKVQQMFKKALVLLEKAKSYKEDQAILDAITQSEKIINTKL